MGRIYGKLKNSEYTEINEYTGKGMSDMFKKIWLQFQRKRKITGYGGLLLCAVFAYTLMLNSIPDKIYVEHGQTPDYTCCPPTEDTHVLQTAPGSGDGARSEDAPLQV